MNQTHTLEDLNRLPVCGEVPLGDEVIDKPWHYEQQKAMVNHYFSQELVEFDLKHYPADHIVVLVHAYTFQQNNQQHVAHVLSNADPIHPDDHIQTRQQIKEKQANIQKLAPEGRMGKTYSLTAGQITTFLKEEENLLGSSPNAHNLRTLFKKTYNI